MWEKKSRYTQRTWKNQRIRKRERAGKPQEERQKEKEQEKERGQQIARIQFLVSETSLSSFTNCPSGFCFNTLVSIILVERTKQDLFKAELLELPSLLPFLTTVPINNTDIHTSKTSPDHFGSLVLLLRLPAPASCSPLIYLALPHMSPRLYPAPMLLEGLGSFLTALTISFSVTTTLEDVSATEMNSTLWKNDSMNAYNTN